MTTEATLAQWNARWAEIHEARQRKGTRTGALPQDMLRDRPGLEVMQAMMEGDVPYPPINETLDFALVEVVEGRVAFQGTPRVAYYNPLGGLHGGWYATLLDSALGCAIHTTLRPGYGYTTVELSMNLVRGATVDTGPLRAIGEVVHSGRQLATAEARLVDAAGKIYAHGTTTCLVFAPKE